MCRFTYLTNISRGRNIIFVLIDRRTRERWEDFQPLFPTLVWRYAVTGKNCTKNSAYSDDAFIIETNKLLVFNCVFFFLISFKLIFFKSFFERKRLPESSKQQYPVYVSLFHGSLLAASLKALIWFNR